MAEATSPDPEPASPGDRVHELRHARFTRRRRRPRRGNRAERRGRGRSRRRQRQWLGPGTTSGVATQEISFSGHQHADRRPGNPQATNARELRERRYLDDHRERRRNRDQIESPLAFIGFDIIQGGGGILTGPSAASTYQLLPGGGFAVSRFTVTGITQVTGGGNGDTVIAGRAERRRVGDTIDLERRQHRRPKRSRPRSARTGSKIGRADRRPRRGHAQRLSPAATPGSSTATVPVADADGRHGAHVHRLHDAGRSGQRHARRAGSTTGNVVAGAVVQRHAHDRHGRGRRCRVLRDLDEAATRSRS